MGIPSTPVDDNLIESIECSPVKKKKILLTQEDLTLDIECSPIGKRSEVVSKDSLVTHTARDSIPEFLSFLTPVKNRNQDQDFIDSIEVSPMDVKKVFSQSTQDLVSTIECSPLEQRVKPLVKYEVINYKEVLDDIEIPSQNKKSVEDDDIFDAKEDSRLFQIPSTSGRSIRKCLFNSMKGTFGNTSDILSIPSSSGVDSSFYFDDDLDIESPEKEETGEDSEEKKTNGWTSNLTRRLNRVIKQRDFERKMFINENETLGMESHVQDKKSVELLVLKTELDLGKSLIDCLVIRSNGLSEEDFFEFEDERVTVILEDEWSVGMGITSGVTIKVFYPFFFRRCSQTSNLLVYDVFWIKVMSRGDAIELQDSVEHQFDCLCRATPGRPIPLFEYFNCHPEKEEETVE